MMIVQEQVKKVFVFGNGNDWNLTTNEVEAKQLDTTYELASISDLDTLVAACGEIIYGKLETSDGVVEHYEKWEWDEEMGSEELVLSEYRLVN